MVFWGLVTELIVMNSKRCAGSPLIQWIFVLFDKVTSLCLRNETNCFYFINNLKFCLYLLTNICLKIILLDILGEVAEWSKAFAWRANERETVPQVRILSSPPEYFNVIAVNLYLLFF